jgi:hypothetical protein
MLNKGYRRLIALCCVLLLALVGCGPQAEKAVDPPSQAEPQDNGAAFSADLTKVSPMIRENVSEEVVASAQKVIEAFLRYENSVEIPISGNRQRFLNDMAYVIDCTCPIFGAFTDFSEISCYDEASGRVSWNFLTDEADFNAKLQDFYDVTGSYLSDVRPTDSQAMRALLLYYAVIDGLQYDEALLGENYDKLPPEEAKLRSSPYYVLARKSGICTNIAQAYMFLCTQADIACATVLHTGGSGIHMWNIVQIDGKFYYCDPTWDANASLAHFGITAQDRAGWAGGYAADGGTLLSVVIPEKYDISDTRFEEWRGKLPVEVSGIKVDRELQTVTFMGYDYECVFVCKEETTKKEAR